jgi:hypothetical protein
MIQCSLKLLAKEEALVMCNNGSIAALFFKAWTLLNDVFLTSS